MPGRSVAGGHKTVEALVQLLAQGRRRLSRLKADSATRYAEFPEGEALKVLGGGLRLLNQKGALAFHED